MLAVLISLILQAGGSDATVYSVQGPSIGFGSAIFTGGDINADGFQDYLVTLNNGGIGAVYGHSGLDGSLLFSLSAPGLTDRGADIVGDVNLDGFADYLVGEPLADSGFVDNGAAHLYSGFDGSILFTWYGNLDYDKFGVAVAGAGDLNLDGWPDLVISSELFGSVEDGHIEAFSGRDGSRLWECIPPDRWVLSEYWGESLAACGDFNLDGIPEILAGSTNGGGRSGGVLAISGASGQIVNEWYGPSRFSDFGHSVAGAGDVDGDGREDVFIGAPLADLGQFQTDVGIAFIYSGRTGVLLRQYEGKENLDKLGWSIATTHDVNGDGVPEHLLGARDGGPTGSGLIELRSGAEGNLLFSWHGNVAGSGRLGSAVAGGLDFNGDGVKDFLHCSTGESPTGDVSLVDFNPFLQADTPRISAATGGLLNLQMDFPDAAAGLDYRLLLSLAGTGPTLATGGTSIPLTADNWMLGSYRGNYPFTSYTALTGVLDGVGDAVADIDFPAGAFQSGVGRSLHLAMVAIGSNGLPAYSSSPASVSITP